MATNFPTSLDTLTNPSPSSNQQTLSHAGQHANANDAIEALEAKVGINGSANTSSLDYKVTTLETTVSTAVLEGDTSTASMSFVIDEDTMVSDSATKIPTQQSVKAYVDTEIAGVSAGGISDGDKGDITVSGSGATWTIDNDAVTYAKMQNISATSRILGRVTALAGNVEELTDANVFSILGITSTATELNYTDGVTSAIQTQLDGKQPLDSDLTTIAGLTATTNNFIISVSNAWASRTPTQALATLGLDADLTTFSVPASTTISAYGATLVDDADAGTARTTLGVVAGGAGDVWVEKAGDTMTGVLTLAENAAIALDPAGSADGKFTGITIAGTAGATLAFGDLIYLDPTDSRWELADANAASGADGDARGILGICVLAAASDGSATTILLNGVVRADTAFPALTINAPVYVSETAGDIVVTKPTTTDVVIRSLGFALTADEIYFNPSSDYITHT